MTKHMNPVAKGDEHNGHSFSFGYWLNGWRKNPDDSSPDILCIETGKYGLQVDVADLGHPRFGRIEDRADYLGALNAGAGRLDALDNARLEVTIDVHGTLYRAVRCRAAASRDVSRLKDIKLWESARLVQHYEFFDLVFENDVGEPLGCMASLNIVAWPEHFALSAEVVPERMYQDGPAEGVQGAGLCIVDKPHDIPHAPERDPECFTAECWFKLPDFCSPNPQGWLLSKNENEQQDGSYGFFFDGRKTCAVMNIGGGPDGEFMIPQKKWIVPSNTWCHVALAYDGQDMRFYLDGELQGVRTIGQPRRPGNGHLRIGQRADGFAAPIRGVYDQLRIWNRALTKSEVAGHTARPDLLSSRHGLVFEENFDALDEQVAETAPWQDAVMYLRFSGGSREWSAEQHVRGVWEAGTLERVTVNCDVTRPSERGDTVPVRVATRDGRIFSVNHEPAYSGYVARVNDLERPKPAEPGDVRAYDEFLVEVSACGNEDGSIPFLLYLTSPASITGLCPILCEEDGTPTGIPVQLSKNWHEPSLNAYLRAYMLLPTETAPQRYLLRIAYGFYGRLPTASHSQLSLVGWGCNGRWDQLAIGCWGETFCLDMDLTPTEQTITDVRAMLVRNGQDGPKWQWSEAGWGGDWLNVSDCKGNRHRFSEIKTAYLAHGPCLSEVRYAGRYGAARTCRLDATVRTLRTDDYVRTFQTLRYDIDADVSIAGGWLHKMGNTHNLSTPYVAYGNRDGLIKELQGPHIEGLGENVIEPGTGALKPRHAIDHLAPVVDMVTLEGDGPWWVAFPGADPLRPMGHRDTFGHASRAMIIRDYRASIGGTSVTAPTIHLKVHAINADSTPNIDLMLMAPKGVTQLKNGDWMEMDVEWITVPRVVDDYYGPNESLRRHLLDHPCSWQTVFREAAGNDLKLDVNGGVVKNRYPLVIEAHADPVTVAIEGGVGAVPVRFDGLASTDHVLYEIVDGHEIALDQSVEGNDFWQTDHDPGTDTFRLTFNLCLDEKPVSRWILREKTRP